MVTRRSQRAFLGCSQFASDQPRTNTRNLAARGLFTPRTTAPRRTERNPFTRARANNRAAVRKALSARRGTFVASPAPTHLSEAIRLPRSSAAFGVDWETGNVVPSSLYASAAAIQPDTLWPPVWVGVTLADSWNSSHHELKTTGDARTHPLSRGLAGQRRLYCEPSAGRCRFEDNSMHSRAGWLGNLRIPRALVVAPGPSPAPCSGTIPQVSHSVSRWGQRG